MNCNISSLVMMFGFILSQSIPAQDQEPGVPVKIRHFQFDYGATIVGVPEGAKLRVWVPVASDSPFQTVRLTELTLPAQGEFNRDQTFNNKILYFEDTKKGTGNVGFKLTYSVQRTEAKATGIDDKSDEKDLEVFLQPNRLVPLQGRPLELFSDYKKERLRDNSSLTDDPERVFYDFVQHHLAYDKTKPGYGNGDVNWACDSKTGNCTDFHSLFISIARANRYPAKFQIGFPLPTERGVGKIGGYHCWAQIYTAKNGWFPVDISEADKSPEKQNYFYGRLNENRVNFSTGRDINLEPRQKADPLNYFIYPHVEIDGKVYPKEKIRLLFGYRDLESK